MKQNGAPLWKAIKKQAKAMSAQFHIPGHRSGKAIHHEFKEMAGQGIFQMDLTEIPGLDDLHNPQEAIAEAQTLAADLYGADKSFFLVNGTSCGIIALIMALCGPGDKIIVPRNAHRSVVSGLILSGALPVYYQPALIPEFGCLTGPNPQNIKDLLHKHKDAKAVVAVNPTYYGVAGDTASVAEVCHQVGVPLLVDEAHGSHLKFHCQLPPDGLSSGADAVVQSTHKTGGALTQSSMLHLKGKRISPEKVAEALRMVQSTSPSYLLMGSLDLARCQMAAQGEETLDKTLDLARWCREKLSNVPGVRVLGIENLRVPGASYLDDTRLTISLQECGLSGHRTAELLHQKYGVIVEMADYFNVVAIVSLGSSSQDCHRLVDAISEIAAYETGEPLIIPETVLLPSPEVVLSPREAWQSPSKSVSLENSLGHVSGETVAVYPPGIPVVCPGEKITPSVLDYLLEVSQQKLKLQGPTDPTLQSLKVMV